MSKMPEKSVLLGRLAELEQSIAQFEKQLDDLRGERKGIRFALGLENPIEQLAPIARASRSNVKRCILDLLEKVGSAGLNATIAVQMAAIDGYELNQGSASSNLSRLKNEGVINYDGDRYRLSKYSSGWPSNVHLHPASKSMP